ncbi:HU family DNA-binding protein [Ornithinimicrobium tianjinense]|uniref:DNA-binding protein HU n=1 Tax=Ornithinimicrobium tianjinense TaxID=1195761 RepID=A0A917F4V8_9MICO|nr:HU family DNA-binding protein [Ornithinimicrobium tianjinense]GGF50588.1 DNA-binding protein HU [Ornithinimicrobium tianjinense]
MNKADLIEALAPRVGGRAAATLAVEGLVDLVLREVAAGGSVVVTGFGTFERVDRAARTGRNPRTGQAVPIDATSSPRFRPAAYFKDVVNDPDRLPTEGLAGVRVASDGSAPQREGVPASVRRGAPGGSSTRQGSTARAATGGAPAPVPATTTSTPTRTRRTASTGTPSTVRATRVAEAPVEEAPTVAPSRGLVTGGEEITRTMINAKKAQLARAKDEASTKKDRSKAGTKDTRKAGTKDEKKSGKKDAKKDAKKGKKGGKGKKG